MSALLQMATDALSRCKSEDTFTFNHVFTRQNSGLLSSFYEVNEEQLGEGSYGTVFQAVHVTSKQIRAVKTIDRAKVKNIERFAREIDIQKQLDHPNVVRLYETFTDDLRYHLVMELCTGGELFDHIINEGQKGFDEARVAKYMKQILSALCYIHSKNFVHRDVKPENFLLSSKDPDADLKIIDFGLAAEQRAGVEMKTKAGTAYYVAPEVLKGNYDEKCDIWSAGVIAYILICGFPPFSGETDEETIRKVKSGYFEFKSPEWDHVSDGAKNMITQMLTLDTKLRPGAEYLLESPWLKYKVPGVPTPISGDFIRRLKCFQAHSRLKRVVITAIVQQLSDEAVAPLKAVFHELDVNNDGKLTSAEVREGLKKNKVAVPNQLEDILKKVDTDGNGELDYTEFLAATVDTQLYMKEDMLQSAFGIFDLNGDGKISKEELTQVLAGQSDSKAAKVKAMIDEVDGNLGGEKDGHIDFEEFKKMMREPSRSMVTACEPAASKRPKKE